VQISLAHGSCGRGDEQRAGLALEDKFVVGAVLEENGAADRILNVLKSASPRLSGATSSTTWTEVRIWPSPWFTMSTSWR
jgi:hypothetical protein